MIYMVELRYIGGDLADLMRDMQTWLDYNQIETQEFHHSSGPPGLAFRVGFSDRDHATAFAEAFDGWLGDTDPQRMGARWTTPPRQTGCRFQHQSQHVQSRISTDLIIELGN
jgi:hypothetical protein